MCAKSLQLYLTVCDSMDCSHQAPLSMGFPGKNTGVGCHALLQGIFSTRISYVSCIGRGRFFTTAPPGKPWLYKLVNLNGAAFVMHLATFDLTRDSLILSKSNTFL